MATIQERAREMVEANGGSITYAQAVRALKARNAKIRAKRAAEEAKQETAQAQHDEDLVKPSELAKELGIHMSVIYGMIKRGTIREHRNVGDRSSMVSRREVESARRGGRKARAAAKAAGEPTHAKSPLKKGQLFLTKRTSFQRTGPEGAQTNARIVKDILADSETGMAIMLDSNGRELFYTADDVNKMLDEGRLIEVQPTFLLDAIGRHMIEEGHDEHATILAEFASEYQTFLESLKPKRKIKVRKVSGTFEHDTMSEDTAPPRKETASERQQRRRLARREGDTRWRETRPVARNARRGGR